MQNTLSIARFEFIMHWRRRGLRVLALTMLVVTLAGIVILQNMPDGQLTQLLNIGGEQLTTNTLLTFLVFLPLICLIDFVFPIIASESIPLDRQLNTLELINTLPITQVEYLAGKILGFAAAGLSALAAGAVITSIAWGLKLGSYDVISYFELWTVAGLVLIINSGIAILIGGSQPNRIRAAALVICLFILSVFLLTDAATTPTIANTVNFAHVLIITYFVNHPTATAFTRLFTPEVGISIVVGAAELFVLFGALWFWRRSE